MNTLNLTIEAAELIFTKKNPEYKIVLKKCLAQESDYCGFFQIVIQNVNTERFFAYYYDGPFEKDKNFRPWSEEDDSINLKEVFPYTAFE